MRGISVHYKNLYQIFDVTAETVVGPIMRENKDGPAVRHFNSLLANKDTALGQHPADYQLLRLGTQDEETGEINSEVEVVTSGVAWLESQPSEAVGVEARFNGAPPLSRV